MKAVFEYSFWRMADFRYFCEQFTMKITKICGNVWKLRVTFATTSAFLEKKTTNQFLNKIKKTWRYLNTIFDAWQISNIFTKNLSPQLLTFVKSCQKVRYKIRIRLHFWKENGSKFWNQIKKNDTVWIQFSTRGRFPIFLQTIH